MALLDAIFEAAFDKACSKEFPTRLAVLPETYKQLKKEVHSMLGDIGEIETMWGMTVIRIPILKNQNALWELS